MPATPQSPDAIGNSRYMAGTNMEDKITATAGGGQSGAYQLSAQISVIDTVVTSGDSVALPKFGLYQAGDARPGGAGQLFFVYNVAANPCQVFGVTPDTINDIATGTGVVLGPGSCLIAWPNLTSAGSTTGDWQAVIINSSGGGYGSAALAPLRFTSVNVGDTAYASVGTNTTDIAGQIWVTSIFIPMTKAITKVGFLQGGTATTDNTLVAIWNSAGTLLSTSALTGVVLSGANTFQEQTLLTPLTLTGPAVYYLGVQGNGTAAGALRTVAASTYDTVYTGIVAAGVFGTVGNLASPPTTFTAGQGPVMTVF
jgi:hypothetical protein